MFGNDPSKLASIPTFGGFDAESYQRQKHQLNDRGGGGGGRPWWTKCYSPPAGVTSSFRLFPAMWAHQSIAEGAGGPEVVTSQMLSHEFGIHRVGGSNGREHICTAGPFHRSKLCRQPCQNCDKYWEEFEAARAAKDAGLVEPTRTVSRTSKHAWATLWWGDFYNVPQLDGKNNIKTDNKNQPRYEWQQVRDQRLLQFFQAQDMVKGRRAYDVRPLVLGYTQNAQLETYITTTGADSCLSCGGTNTLTTQAAACTGCGHVFAAYDVMQGPASLDRVQSYLMASCPCPQCGTNAPPRGVLNCSGCNNPKRQSPFDVWFLVTPTKSVGANNKVVTNLSFSHQLHHNAPLPLTADELKDVAEVPDLVKMFAP